MKPLSPSRLSAAAWVTCLGESLQAAVGNNKSNTDAFVFDGSDIERYKDWKGVVLRKVKMSACLYPTPSLASCKWP